MSTSVVRAGRRAVRRWRRVTIRRASRSRLRWAIRIRSAVIALFLGVAVTASFAGISPWLVPALAAAGAGALMNASAAFCVRRGRAVAPMLAWTGIGDAVLITYVVNETGGVASPFLFLYVVQVLTSALVVDAGAGAVAAALSVTFWGLAAWLRPTPASRTPLPPGSERLVWALSLILTLALLVLIGGYLAQRLARRERELAGAHRRLRRSMDRIARAHGDLQSAYGRLARAEAQLVSSEKMRSLGVLVAGLAHELGNPLTVLAGNLDPLEEHFASYDRLLASVTADQIEPRPAEIAELRRETPALLANCREATERAVALLAQLRAFGRGGAATRRLSAVRPGLESTLALVRHRLPPETIVITSFDDVPDVSCVPAELNQVFMNLLLNAADALRPGGTLSIGLAAENGDLSIRVADDGVGIPSDVLPHLFEPFFTTKDTGAGSGLGLAISHAIVARHGGTLDVEAPAAGGAVFTIRLPLPEAAASDDADECLGGDRGVSAAS